MSNSLEIVIAITEKEYRGTSFNGPSLRKMLDALTLEEVKSTDTYEGYSVWAIVLHLMYWKYQLAAWLGAPELPVYPYQQNNWAELPANPSLEAWQETVATMDKIHAAYVSALRTLPESKLEEKIEAWGCSWADGIAWMTTHDTYHIAHIRNMGLKHFDES